MALMEWKNDDMAPYLQVFPPAVMQIGDYHTRQEAYEREIRYQPSRMLERDRLRHELTLVGSLVMMLSFWHAFSS